MCSNDKEYHTTAEPKSSKELWKAEVKCCKRMLDDAPFHVVIGCGGARDKLSLDKTLRDSEIDREH